MLSILSSQENNCSLLFSCLEFHLEAYSEPCQTSKMMLLPKILNGFLPLNNFTKIFILDVWQGSDFASVIFSKVPGLQLSDYNFTKRWTPSHVFFKDFGNLAGTLIWRNTSGWLLQKRQMLWKVLLKFMILTHSISIS